MRYALLWSRGGRQERAVLTKGEYFLGRLMREDAERLGREAFSRLSPYRVYLFTPDMSEFHDTGIDSLIVGRRHAKLLIREEGRRPTLWVIDYGKRGDGTKNGTYVNGERLPPGKPFRLSSGDTLRLGTLGPSFTVGTHAGGKTLIRTITGIPAQVPAQVAAELERLGVVADRRDVGNVSYVVLLGTGSIDLGNLVIKAVAPESKRVEFLKKMHVAITTLDQVIEALAEEDVETAIAELEKLSLETMKKFILGLGDPRIGELYNEIFSLVRLGGTGIEYGVLKRKVRTLRNSLASIMNMY